MFAGQPCRRGKPQHGYRCVQVHAGGEPRPDDAGVPGADDRLPAPALEREPQGHA